MHRELWYVSENDLLPLKLLIMQKMYRFFKMPLK